MQEDLNELLNNAKELLKDEMTNISYETWIKNLEIESFKNDNLILRTETAYKQDVVEKRYYDLILNTFKIMLNKDINLSFSNNEDSKDNDDSHSINSSAFVYNSSLNPKYTFDTFVVGNNNRFAHAASLAVAESPSVLYNPLFIYGGVGLGKTHLMHAIGNEVLRNNRNANVLYVTSENFTNQLVNAIRDGSMEQFRNKYRNIDVILIDDVQFIAGKERIQEEFFHTFNTLHESGRQIVLSSDRPPKEIKLLEDRLKSRFEWGLTADVSIPDYETRLAILRKKAANDNIIVDDEILSNIATKLESNIRELEGALNKLVATSSLTHDSISIEMSEKAINDIISKKEKVISPEYIQETVCKYFNINIADLKGSRRSNDIAYPRQIAMYLCREVAQMSLPKIGDAFGKRDHTTVLHGCNKIDKEIKENTNTKLIVDSVKNILLNSKE